MWCDVAVAVETLWLYGREQNTAQKVSEPGSCLGVGGKAPAFGILSLLQFIACRLVLCSFVCSPLLHSHHGDEVWKKYRMFLVVQMFPMNSPFRTESEGGLEGEECF